MKIKICVITGSRAEYGLLRPLLCEIKKDPALKLQLIATGMHLSSEFGYTYRQIEGDGFAIDEKVKTLSNSDSPVAISISMGLGMAGCAKAYKKLKPDIIVVMGDRFEIFSAVASALVFGIPVAHLSGGELSEGAYDDAFRHSITKMSYLHFTSTPESKRRVMQLGEDPKRVFNVGEIGLDNIRKLKLLSRDELQKELGFRFKRHNILVTFHPVTLEPGTAARQFKELLGALDLLKETGIIFTKANADTGGRVINKMIDAYVSKNSGKAKAFTSMGQLKYLSMMRISDAVVGNSSSGIVEAPTFKVGTINIGDRQKGRQRPESVIDCESDRAAILKAFGRLYSSSFKRKLGRTKNPYGDGRSAKKVKDILKGYKFPRTLKKKFYDMGVKA